MPTVSVERDLLFAHLKRTYTDKEFDELCFEFGVELDEVTSEREEAEKSSAKLSKAQLEAYSDAIIYKIDVPANRYDLLCLEGLVRALRIFLGDLDSPTYSLSVKSPQHVLTVHPATQQVRPFVVAAILRDLKFTQERYDSFIELQDQLHRNLCRQRTLVAIGTHDLDTVEGPFVYDARKPSSFEFVPLTHSEAFRSDKLLELYETDPACKHLKPYVPIIKDSPVYPVVLDAKETVMSLPPIINGSHSKITLNTTNVFVECTATDLTKANVVLDTVVTMFSEYCAKPFTVEPVRVKYLEPVKSSTSLVKEYTTPQLYSRQVSARVDFVNSLIGIHLEPAKMADLCQRVQLAPAQLLDKDQILQVTVPPTRSDILHPVDVAEDVGIAYGYNNIVKRIPTTSTVGGEFALNQLTDLLRDEIARAGYTEVLTHGLCSIHDNFTALGRPADPSLAVSLSNPANVEYQVVRTTLLPGLLKTYQHNKAASFTAGFRLFEISDVVLRDETHVVTETIVGARNVRRICATYAGPTSKFELLHGLVDRILGLCEVAPAPEYVAQSGKAEEEERKFRVCREGWFYTIVPLPPTHASAGTFFAGRAAQVVLRKLEEEVSLGTFGTLHPAVLDNFDIQYPVSCMELDLEPLL